MERSPDPVAGAILDPAAVASLSDLLGGDAEAMAEIVDEFLAEAPQRIAEIRTGTDTDDTVLARRGAHTLKANALTFGATGLAEVSRTVEEAAANGDMATVAALVGAVDAEWSNAEPALRKLRGGVDS